MNSGKYPSGYCTRCLHVECKCWEIFNHKVMLPDKLTEEKKLITEEEYLKALEIVTAYQKQLSISVDEFILSKVGQMSTRLYNLLRATNKRQNNEPVFTNLNEITKEDFLRVRNAGETTWNEFVKLRGF